MYAKIHYTRHQRTRLTPPESATATYIAATGLFYYFFIFYFFMTINLMHQHRSIEIANIASVNLKTLQNNTQHQQQKQDVSYEYN